MAETEETYFAEAEATSRDPHDWGRAMALAVTRLAGQLAPAGSPDIHASLVGRDLRLRIRDDPAGVTISISSEAGPGGSEPGLGADEPEGRASG
jgi:hypothetical protein